MAATVNHHFASRRLARYGKSQYPLKTAGRNIKNPWDKKIVKSPKFGKYITYSIASNLFSVNETAVQIGFSPGAFH
jgi:hypothetical protein